MTLGSWDRSVAVSETTSIFLELFVSYGIFNYTVHGSCISAKVCLCVSKIEQTYLSTDKFASGRTWPRSCSLLLFFVTLKEDVLGAQAIFWKLVVWPRKGQNTAQQHKTRHTTCNQRLFLVFFANPNTQIERIIPEVNPFCAWVHACPRSRQNRHGWPARSTSHRILLWRQRWHAGTRCERYLVA